jgi:hypothetical protein
MIIQRAVTRRRDEYTYLCCLNRQQGTCPAPYVNVTVAEHAVERYYATVSQQQIVNATGHTHHGRERKQQPR